MDIDTSRAARKPSERKAIARYVYETKEAIETDWLEWKSTFDLSQTKYRAATAKHILAFAQPPPGQGAAQRRGTRYLLISVGPGELPGVPEMRDPEKIESWLSPYIGDDVTWAPAYVEIDGNQVLFITVEAPQWGDPPFPVRKESVDEADKTLREGWIYVRRAGKSDQVTAAEHDMLIERARRRATRLKLAIEVEGGPLRTIAREVQQHEYAEEAIKRTRSRVLRGVPETRGMFEYGSLAEPRTPEKYRSQVEAYLDLVRQRWPTVVADDVIENKRIPVTLGVANLTEEVFESVQVEIRMPTEKSWVYISSSDLKRRLSHRRNPRLGAMRLGLSRAISTCPCRPAKSRSRRTTAA